MLTMQQTQCNTSKMAAKDPEKVVAKISQTWKKNYSSFIICLLPKLSMVNILQSPLL